MTSLPDTIESGIAGYLRQVRRQLANSGRSPAEADAVAADLEDQIRTQLAGMADGSPGVADLHAVLARMDPPDSFGEASIKPASPSPPGSAARPARGLVFAAAGVLLLILAAAVAYYVLTDIRMASSPQAPAAERGHPVPAPGDRSETLPAPRVGPAGEPDVPRAAPTETPSVAPAVVTNAQSAVSVPVAVTPFTTSDNIADREVVAATLADGLLNAFSLDARLRVVERAKLAQAMTELRMSAEGTVDQATAVKLGRMTGAQVIVLGNIVKLDDKLIVTARLMNPETSELSAIRVTGPRGELLSLTDELAQNIANRIGKDDKGTFARRTSAAEQASLRARQTAVKKAIAGKKLPRVLVMIPETHLERRIPDPAGETELVLWLTDCGFLAVSPEYEGVRPPPAGADTASDTNITFRRNRGLRNEEGGIRVSSRTLHTVGKGGLGAQRDALARIADVIIIGEGISERATEKEGIVSCKARLELKAVAVRSGEVLVAKSTYGAGVDVAEHIAGKRALQAAGREMAADLIPELVEKWQKLAGE